MNRNKASICILIFFLSSTILVVCGENEYEIAVPYGSSPTIDGLLGAGEWNDGISVSLNYSRVTQVAFVKYDSENLYVGFNVSDSTIYEDNDCAAIIMDLNHDGGTNPQIDDIAFCVYRNGTAHEFRGNGTPLLTPSGVSGWSGAAHEEYDFWTAEFNITFAKIGIASEKNQTFGIVIEAGDYYAVPYASVYTWPPKVYVGGPEIQNWGDLISTEGWRAPEPPEPPLDLTLFYFPIILAAAIVVVAVFFVMSRRKKPAEEIASPSDSTQI